MPDSTPLDLAIAQLEAQRATLGDAAVDAAVQALRAHSGAAAATPRLRQVSVLFIDVAESTSMLQRLAAEDALAVMNGALETFARIVRKHGGEVLRFTGDGLKAAFGTQGLREDDAEQAVRAGLRVLEAAQAHGEQVARQFGIGQFGVRAGIHTGTVLLGAGAEADRTAMGHAVHVAARMEQSAPVGRLRISHETRVLVRDLFRVQAQPPLVVKGVDEPLRTYLVRGEEDDSERTVRRSVEGVRAPMLGRDEPLRQLRAHLGAAMRAGRPALAALVGEAGIGKTRLRRELLRGLEVVEGVPAPDAAGAQPPHCLRARAAPSAALQPFGLLRQLLARWLGIADDLPSDAARARWLEGLAPWLMRDATVRAERLGQLVGLDFGERPAVQALAGRELRAQGLAALREALQSVAARAPLVLVLEDLHWADEASLDFVDELLRQPGPGPLLLLLIGRPAWAERWPLQAAAQVEQVPSLRVALSPLSGGDDGRLLDALLAPAGSVPAALRQALLQRAGGNPFYLEELVRMLVDDGTIDTRTRPWRIVATRLPALRMPESLVGVLQARLDALPRPELTALQLASIVGATFWVAALAALDAQAPQRLPELLRRGFIVRRPGSAFADTDEFAFQHQALQEVTYATALKAARHDGHARVARWLAARVGGREGEFLAVTAEHYACAGDSTQALAYYVRAQRGAYARFAHQAALELIDRALAQPALTDRRQRFLLLQSRHNVFDRLERADDARTAQRAMQEWAELCNDDALRAEVCISRALRADHEGRPDEARRFAEQALALGERSGDMAASSTLALAHGEVAWLAVADRDFATAERHLAEGVQHARRCATLSADDGGYDGYETQLHCISVKALLLQERFSEAARAAEASHDDLVRTRPSRLHDRYILLEYLVEAQRETGQPEAARATAQRSLELALALAMPRLHASALAWVAETALDLGQPDAANDAVEQALSVLQQANNEFIRPAVLRARGRLCAVREQWHAAHEAWQQAAGPLQAQGRQSEWRELRAQQAQLALRRASPAEAVAGVHEVLAPPAGAAEPDFDRLTPRTLIACLQVLDAAVGDSAAACSVAIANHLQQRLQRQLAALPTDAERSRLRERVAHWVALERHLAGRRAADVAASAAAAAGAATVATAQTSAATAQASAAAASANVPPGPASGRQGRPV